MSRILAIAIPIVILLVLGVGGAQILAALAPEAEEATEPPQALSVFAEPVRTADLKLTVKAQGEVRPRREIALSAQVSGRISYVSPNFEDGGFIRRGETLARIETADFELAVVRAQSVVAAAEQRLAREQAEAEIALQDLQDLGIDDPSPLARREPQLAEAQASLDSAMAQLRDAELALERTAIRSPFEGRVREKSVDIGQFVSPGVSIGRVFSTDAAEVALPINDDELGRIGLPLAFAETAENPGPPVVFSQNVAGLPRTWTGRVTRTAAAFNAQSRLINVFAEVEDPYGAGADDGAPMAPGLFVSAEVQGATIEDIIWAPRSALRGTDRLFVGDLDESVLRIRQVDLIYSDESGAYLRSGVEPGELAIVSPIQAAFDGMRIEILERAEDGTIINRSDDVNDTSAQADSTSAVGGTGGIAQ
ncbi:MAG: efflux RND transporter periplasmic adaptor subunit [Pseudomonadota bacterium]